MSPWRSLSCADSNQLTRSSGLTVHHTIEERHIFPLLAKRMTSFQDNEVHLKSHEGIHHGAPHVRAIR